MSNSNIGLDLVCSCEKEIILQCLMDLMEHHCKRQKQFACLIGTDKACGISNEDQISELAKSSGTTSLNDIIVNVNEDHISGVDDLEGTDKACGISNEDQISELAKSSGLGTTSLNDIVVNEDHISAVDDLEGSEKACKISNEDQSLTISVAKEVGIEEKDPIKIIASGPFSYEKRKLILSWGPHQPQKEDMSKNCFPMRNNRSFLPSWYKKTLPDGTTSSREWFSYSCSTDRIFCLYCILIGNDKQSVWVTTGFGTWSKATQRLIMHETSSFHVEASLKLKLEDQCVPLQPSILRARNTFVATNRLIVTAIIDIILYLAQHSLALRGHRENWETNLRGNFKDLVCLLGKYHPVLGSYIAGQRLKKKTKYDFISWRRQNELIDAMAGYTRGVILKQIKCAKFFSITLDSTFDNSRKEQLSFVIRYIHDETAEAHERLISMKECANTSAQNIFEIVEQICAIYSLDWKQYLVGQSFDGASNMRGAYNGLQAIIKRSNPAAVFVWCYAHRLNLVVIDAVSCSPNAVDMFGILESIYDFICSSKKRVALFDELQEKIYGSTQRKRRFKRVETTRWWSHDHALNTVLDTFDALCDTLQNIQNNECSSDRKGAHQARSLKENIIKMLQAKDIDLIGVIDLVKEKIQHLETCRSDIEFSTVLNQVEEFKKFSINECEDFKPIPHNRIRRVPRKADEIAVDEVIEDPLQNYKIKTYFIAFDTAITQIKERFNEISSGLFKDLSLFSRRRMEEISNDLNKLPVDAFKVFSDTYSKFVDKEDLKREYVQFIKCYFNFEKVKLIPTRLHDSQSDTEDESIDHLQSDLEDSQNTVEDFTIPKLPLNGCSLSTVLKVVKISGLQSVFPVLSIALKIAVTLPVASTTPERTFSKLTIIKNKLRSTMTEGRLENLMVLSCENDIKIDSDTVINTFANNSSLLQKALLY
ncbi:uncharacterized protein LOC132943679 [Metopolophium dirhodum]|uniref:uncharacterized protein LOC132943679 n=1 Tax=Metopolophium dirhodum TaxID=44670 RepID=UPI00298F46B7|nr:uncharacterized protein LOC132943679 [Metopolophium dirhodum]